MSPRMQRRDFLKTTAAIGIGVGASVGRLGARAESPNNKLNLAVIGLGGQGAVNLSCVASQNIVALCDVDDVRAGKAYERFPKAKKYSDFRTMFDKMSRQIDAVVVSTPDHTHFHPAYHALQMDKHVYLEKPMAHSIWEVRKLTALAAEKKVATQLGVQRHAIKGLRRAVELIRSGILGTVRECHSWIDSSRGMPAMPKERLPVPSHLKWDLWLGPVAERPYSPDYVPYKWRFWWDFGTGDAGNFGCHILDIPFWALGLKYPTKVAVEGADPDPQRTPTSMTAHFDFPAEAERPPIVLHWYQGVPPVASALGLPLKGMNTLVVGSEGTLLCGFAAHRLLPEDKFKERQEPRPFLPPSPGFHQEWFDACKGGAPASCDFAYSGPLTETVLLANVAFRAKGGFTWDHAAMKAEGNPNAEQYLRPNFRKGWEMGSL
jgi:predicted dehydrogenase